MSGKIYYWDSCVWISWLTGQERPGTQAADLERMGRLFETEDFVLLTSAVTRAEVLNATLTSEQQEQFRRLFRRRRCVMVDVTRPVIDLCHDIRSYYKGRQERDRLPTLTLPDALHLATAITHGVKAFHTFDQHDEKNKRRALVPLSGNVAGHNLTVCFPFLDGSYGADSGQSILL